MKSLHIWIVGAVLALAAGARVGTLILEKGVLPASSLFALSEVYSSSAQSATSIAPAQSADVSVLQTGGSASVQRNLTGDTPIAYGFAVTNKGPMNATNVHVVFPVPAGLTFDSASLPDCALQGDAVNCVFSQFPNGQTLYPLLRFHLPAPVGSCESQTVQYRVFSWSDTLDNQTNNNQFSVTTMITCPQVSSASSWETWPSSSASVGFSSSSSAMSRSSSASWETWPSSSAASQAADISLRTVTTPTFKPGDIINYDVYVKNNGPQNANNVILAFYVPFGPVASYVRSTSDPRCVLVDGSTVITCNLGPLAVNSAEVLVHIAVQISPQYVCNGDFWSQVIAGSSPQDFNQENSRVVLKSAVSCGSVASSTLSASRSSSSSTISRVSSASSFQTIPPPSSAASSVSSAFDVVLVPSAPVTLNKGDVAVYTLAARNAGPANVDAVSVSLIAPFGGNAIYVPEQSTPGCTFNASAAMVTCMLGRMSAGQELSARIAVRLQQTCDTTLNVQTLTNNLYYDTNQSNNRVLVPVKITCSSSASSAVKSAPSSVNPNARVDVQVVQAYMNAKVAQAGTIIHSFTVDNNGPDTAQNVVLTESIPSGFTFVSMQSDSRCTQVGSNVACSISSIVPYEPVTLKIALKAGAQQPCGIVTGTVTMTSAGQETNTFNNTITAQTKVLCVSAAKWNVSVQPGGDAGSASRGQKNITLMRFTIVGDSSRDTVITGARFAAAAGSVMNAQSYTLWMDMDYNGTTESIFKTVTPVNGVVTFSDLPGGGQIISAGRTMAFEVHADFAQAPVSDKLQLAFDTVTPDYLSGEANDGALTKVSTNNVCPTGNNCQINVSTSASKLWNITSAGNLYITKDAEPINQHQLLAGTLADPVLRLNFHATNEEIEVYKLQISTWDSTAVSVDHLELYRTIPESPIVVSETPFATATVAGCGSDSVPTVNTVNGKQIKTFCATFESKQVMVNTYYDVDVVVRPVLKTDNDGAIDGESLIFWLPARGAVKARGVTSSNDLADNDDDWAAEGEIFVGVSTPTTGMNVVGNPNQVVLGKIASITNAASNPGQVIAYPSQEIGRYRFSAANNNNSRNGINKPVITDIIFSVVTSNVTFNASTFKIANTADYQNRKDCAVVAGGDLGETLVECRNLSYKADPTIDLSLQVDVTGGGTSNAWIQSSLKNFADINNFVFGPYPGQTRLRWLDTDAASSKEFLWSESAQPVIYSTKFMKM